MRLEQTVSPSFKQQTRRLAQTYGNHSRQRLNLRSIAPETILKRRASCNEGHPRNQTQQARPRRSRLVMKSTCWTPNCNCCRTHRTLSLAIATAIRSPKPERHTQRTKHQRIKFAPSNLARFASAIALLATLLLAMLGLVAVRGKWA